MPVTLSGVFERLGFFVLATVYSAETAIEAAARERPDLILMDIRLKGSTDGIQAAQTIRLSMDVPIIYLTAYSNAATVERAKASEYDGFILKPFQRRELQTTVEVAMQRHTLRAKREIGGI
jgi:CheY-like chemotaxis protein